MHPGVAGGVIDAVTPAVSVALEVASGDIYSAEEIENGIEASFMFGPIAAFACDDAQLRSEARTDAPQGVVAAAAPIGYDGARHLLNRTGFAATDAEIRTPVAR